jgi:uncharacterized protein YciI
MTSTHTGGTGNTGLGGATPKRRVYVRRQSDRRAWWKDPKFGIQMLTIIVTVFLGALKNRDAVRDEMRDVRATVQAQGTLLTSVSTDVRKISDQNIAMAKDQEDMKRRTEENAKTLREHQAWIDVLNKDVALIKGKLNFR